MRTQEIPEDRPAPPLPPGRYVAVHEPSGSTRGAMVQRYGYDHARLAQFDGETKFVEVAILRREGWTRWELEAALPPGGLGEVPKKNS